MVEVYKWHKDAWDWWVLTDELSPLNVKSGIRTIYWASLNKVFGWKFLGYQVLMQAPQKKKRKKLNVQCLKDAYNNQAEHACLNCKSIEQT